MKKGLIILLLLFILIYVLNYLTPMLNEDYFAAFVWPEGVVNLGTLPENARRVSGFSDVLENIRVYYMTEGGRVPGGVPGTVFSWLGKEYFNPLNALVLVLLIMEIYWLSHEGKITFAFNPTYIFWIFFCLWSFNIGFVDTCLWMSGSSNYLWMQVVVFAFLIPYVKNYYNNNFLNKSKPGMSIGFFFAGVLAGWSHETTICWVIPILFYWLYLCQKRKDLQNWKIAGFLGLCTGYALLILAPGNFSRLVTQQQTNAEITLTELYMYKFSELAWIAVFHFVIWYFIISFLIRDKNKVKQKDIVEPYLKIVRACSLVAFGSGFCMFILPVSGWRPSFLSLVFLIVAAASLFRVQEIAGVCIINNNIRSFLKVVGYFYLAMTIGVSLWCNYSNGNYWNTILERIYQEQQSPTNEIIIVNPYYTDNKVLLKLSSGFHLVYMPVVYGDENNRINAILAKYYGIKGIKKERK